MIAGKPRAATSFFTSPLLEPLQQSPVHVGAVAPALVTADAQHIELEVAEYDGTVAGHWPQGER
jgi:hypothetical protein